MPIIDDKERGPNGDHRGRDGIAHHCHECRGAEKESCWYNGHLALCEVEDCRKRFNARWGCVKHRYREAYNLRAKAQFFGEDFEDLEKKFAWMKVRSTEGQEAGPSESDTLVDGDEKAVEKTEETRPDPPKEAESKTKTPILVKTRELTPQQSTKLGRKYKESSPSPKPEEAPREEPKSNAKTRKREKFAALMEKKMGKHASGAKKPGRIG